MERIPGSISGPENAQSSTPRRTGCESLLKGLPPWQDRSGSTTAIPSTVGLPPSWMVRRRRRSSSSDAFATSTDRAFTAWLSTDPFNNAQAPPGPIFMPEYHNAKHEQFLGLNKQAADIADQGTKSGETGDQYVRITVLLATVLLITAIGQRFRFKAVRDRFYDSCLPVALPATFATAYAASHLNRCTAVRSFEVPEIKR